MGNHSHSCKFAGKFFILALVSPRKYPAMELGGNIGKMHNMLNVQILGAVLIAFDRYYWQTLTTAARFMIYGLGGGSYLVIIILGPPYCV